MPVEFWVAVVGIVGSIGTALGYVLKRRGDAQLQRALAENLEAQAALKKVEAESNSSASMFQMFQQQITINQQNAAALEAERKEREKEREQWRKDLEDKEKKVDSNYRVIRDVQDDGNTALMNIAKLLETMQQSIDALPGKLLESTAADAQTFAKEIASSIAGEFARRAAEQDMAPFPGAEDKGWRECMVTPVTDRATMYMRPVFSDWTVLTMPCATITEAVKVRVFVNCVEGWHAIVKGDCWGWIREQAVKVGELEPTATAF